MFRKFSFVLYFFSLIISCVSAAFVLGYWAAYNLNADLSNEYIKYNISNYNYNKVIQRDNTYTNNLNFNSEVYKYVSSLNTTYDNKDIEKNISPNSSKSILVNHKSSDVLMNRKNIRPLIIDKKDNIQKFVVSSNKVKKYAELLNHKLLRHNVNSYVTKVIYDKGTFYRVVILCKLSKIDDLTETLKKIGLVYSKMIKIS